MSSTQGCQSSGQEDRHVQSSNLSGNLSPQNNKSVRRKRPRGTSNAVPEVGDHGGNGSDSKDDRFTRRLVILNHSKRRKLLGRVLGRTPYPREDVIEKLLDESWRPQCCFVSLDSRGDSSPPKITWEEMKNPKENHRKIVLSEAFQEFSLEASQLALSVKIFETVFHQYLGELNEEIKTIMVMTIGKKKDFQGVVRYLSPESNIGFDHAPPYVAMLETNDGGDSWHKDPTLKQGQWNLVYSHQGASPNTRKRRRSSLRSGSSPAVSDKISTQSPGGKGVKRRLEESFSAEESSGVCNSKEETEEKKTRAE